MAADTGALNSQAVPLLDVESLCIDYVTPGRAPAHAVVDLSFQLRRGEVMGLVGESGCGKSTLALALMRLLPAAGRITHGTIRLQGADLLALGERELAEYRWQRIAMVFQGAMNALNPVRTIGDRLLKRSASTRPYRTSRLPDASASY